MASQINKLLSMIANKLTFSKKHLVATIGHPLNNHILAVSPDRRHTPLMV
jgi:hypothetical protein